MSKVPITRYGYYRLVKELTYLRRVVRPKVLEELQEARSYGVKLNNQQYLHARERHVVLQRKIQDIEEKLARSEVFVGRKFYFRQAGFGTVIAVLNVDTGQAHEYQLVGPYESDVNNGKLSIESPVGRCLMGRREGDEVAVSTPAGVRVYRILSIQA
ncbi:GreA/GreB family elongation factor [Desulfoferrobacter suflitae]|uniref:GreA/GreB family elongation factor n=1 Tax=Desulfoferrobacter suflitae TaxID=2865782 RepID=UPI0021641EFB|nr:transcription elongation factor GreA [Desulfoferrobacter suflitae]MCK8602346.1 transcription elongation factor GreA [Desulfoferrobacter suflitae]